jgi:hypothetical protein
MAAPFPPVPADRTLGYESVGVKTGAYVMPAVQNSWK